MKRKVLKEHLPYYFELEEFFNKHPYNQTFRVDMNPYEFECLFGKIVCMGEIIISNNRNVMVVFFPDESKKGMEYSVGLARTELLIDLLTL